MNEPPKTEPYLFNRWSGGTCKECGGTVLVRDGLEFWAMDYYWQCQNPICLHYEGEATGDMDSPCWVFAKFGDNVDEVTVEVPVEIIQRYEKAYAATALDFILQRSE